MKDSIQFLSDQQVAAVLTPAVAVDAVTKALLAHAGSACQMPLKPYLRPGGREKERTRGRFIAMPASVDGDVNAVGLKWIASVPANINKGLERASGLIILNDPETGHPISIMECATLSARRTAAVAKLVVEHFGIPNRPIAVFGAGPIAREVIHTLATSGLGAEYRVLDLNISRAESLAGYLKGDRNINAIAVKSTLNATQDCGAILCCTTGAKSYLAPEDVPDSCRLMFPLSLDDFTEEAVLTADRIVCDDFDQCNREEKLFHHLVQKGLVSREGIYAELGEVISGKKPGRTGNERYFVNTMGIAIEDVAVARAVLSLHQDKKTNHTANSHE